MSGGVTGAIIAGGAIAAAGAAASMYSANKQASAQSAAARRAEKQAQQEAERQQQAQRRNEQNSADTSGILQAAQDAALSGGSTLLTGAGGVSNDQLNLGGGGALG